MGFRTSFYHYPIDYLESIKNTPRDENDWLYFEFEDEKDHELLYDAFTNSVLKIYKDNQYASPALLNAKDSDDYLQIRMNKEQFRNFIKYLLKNHVDYKKEHIVRVQEFDKLSKELKDGYQPDPNHYIKEYKEFNIIDKLISNQLDFNFCADMYTADYTYIDEILKNPWKISACWETQQTISNLIHIYHMMNWNKEEIVILGN